jgi:hypothetical protein
MRFVIFSDCNYKEVAQNLIDSLDKLYGDANITYYTVGFNDPGFLNSLNLKIDYRYFPKKILPNLNFLKPSILLKSLDDYKEEKNFIFLDSDITIGKRFDPYKISSSMGELPISPFGPYETPYTFRTFEDGTVQNYTPDLLMNYLNVPDRSCRYVQNCLICYNRNHSDFILEWESISLNKFLLQKYWEYFPFQDETSFNVLLWKYLSKQNLGHIFVNTHKSSTYKLVESSEIYELEIDNNPYEYCKYSGDVMFYHGTKDREENRKIQNYINENSTNHTRTSSYTS